jgi:ATP/ADP translocase
MSKVSNNFKKYALNALAAVCGGTMVLSCLTQNFLSGFAWMNWFTMMPWYLTMIFELTGWGLLIYSCRSIVWRVEREDFKFFIPAALMMFAILITYVYLRIQKTVLLKETMGLSYIIPAKVLAGVFCTLFSIYFTKVSKKFKPRHGIIVAFTPLLAFFAFYVIVCVNHSWISGSGYKLALNQSILPNFTYGSSVVLDYFKRMVAYWPNLLYYIVVEGYSSAILVVCFWKTAVRFVPKERAKKLLPPISLLAQFASLVSSFVSKELRFLSRDLTAASGVVRMVEHLPHQMYFTLALVIITSAVIILCNYRLFDSFELNVAKKKAKQSISFFKTVRENISFVLIVLTSVFFGAIQIPLEQFFRVCMGRVYTSPAGFKRFSSGSMIIQSRVAIVLSSVLSNLVPKYFSWFTSAVPSALIAFITVIVMFGGYLIMNGMNFRYTNHVVIYSGVILLALYRSSKYAFLDLQNERWIKLHNREEQGIIKNIAGAIGKYGKIFSSLLIFVFTGIFGGWSSFVVGIFFGVSTIISSFWVGATVRIANDMPQVKPSDKKSENNPKQIKKTS